MAQSTYHEHYGCVYQVCIQNICTQVSQHLQAKILCASDNGDACDVDAALDSSRVQFILLIPTLAGCMRVTLAVTQVLLSLGLLKPLEQLEPWRH
jgi:hypothetical protein